MSAGLLRVMAPERPTTARALAEARAPLFAGALIGCIVALLLAALLWSALARVEEVVAAPGRVTPASRVKIVSHPQGGRVAQVHVRNGDAVSPEDPLVTLDRFAVGSERAELEGRWQARAIAAARLTAEAGRGGLSVEPAVAAARPDLLEAEHRLMVARDEALASRRDAAGKAVAARRNEVRSAAAEASRASNSVTLQRQQLGAIRELAARGLYPELKRVTAEKQVSDAEGESAKAGAASAASQAALAESEAELAAVDKEWRSGVLAELQQVAGERDRLAEQLRARDAELSGLVIRAPVAGVVQELAVTGAGQSVAATEPLLKLVPAGDGLVVEAKVRNEDIGRLRPGMAATVKVRTFDWLRFGALEGVVEQIAADADRQGDEAAYDVRIVTGRSYLGAGAGELDMASGMVVDVEVKVGERSILSFLTERIFQVREAFREA